MAAGDEVRIFAEGALRWVEASGTGATWVTASGATTGLLTYVQAGMSVQSARTVATIKDRGVPTHFKIVGRDAIQVQFTYQETDVAQRVPYTATAGGASIPLYHLELKSDAPENDATAVWRQFIRGARSNEPFTEGEEGNTVQDTWMFIAMNGPTGSGYIA